MSYIKKKINLVSLRVHILKKIKINKAEELTLLSPKFLEISGRVCA